MITGRQAFATIEGAISEEQAAILELESKLEDLLQQAEDLRQAEIEDYRNLARLRLDDIASGDIVGRLNRVEEQAIQLLGARAQAQDALRARQARLEERIAALGAKREELTKEVSAAEENVANAEASTRARLEKERDFVDQRDLAHKIDILASNADEKASQSESELASKRAAYEDSALFMYLWNRDYGTAEYSANSLIRALDAWVAKLVRFEDTRASYFRLQEIPKRLREHAERLTVEASDEEAKLEALWQQARQEDGLEALDGALAKANQNLDAIQEELESVTAELQEVLDELGGYAAGEDELTTKAVAIVSKELEERDTLMLFRQARETLRAEDDLIVSRILDRDQNIRSLDTTRHQVKATLDRRLTRLKELTGVSREFNRRNYARANSVFRDGALIAMLLRDFRNGGVSQEVLWDQIVRQQRWRQTSPRPSISPRRRTTFGGGTRTGGGGFGGGRSSGRSRSSGGGFSTRGGF